MRITNNMMINSTIRNINDNLTNLSRLQTQAASLKTIQVPSDDPITASRSLRLSGYLSDIEQRQQNADDAASWMNYSDSALDQIGDILSTIRELTVEAANGTLTDDDRSAIGDQIEQLQNGIIDIANSSYAGRYIFAGYSTDAPPFAISSTDLGDMVTYNGRFLSLGGVFSPDIPESDIVDFYMGHMDEISGQPELVSAIFGDFTAPAGPVNVDITLDGVTQTVDLPGLTDGNSYDIDAVITALQSGINDAFPSSDGQVEPLILIGRDNNRLVLTVQDGDAISISNGSVNAGALGFTDGMSSSVDDNEELLYKLGASNYIPVNLEGGDIFGQGESSLFNTLSRLQLALGGETSYQTASYGDSGVTVEVRELDISGLLSNLDEDINRLTAARSDLGARTSYVELTQTRLRANNTTYTQLLSNNDDVDLAEISVALASAQATYTAALNAGADVIQNTLLDFLV